MSINTLNKKKNNYHIDISVTLQVTEKNEDLEG